MTVQYNQDVPTGVPVVFLRLLLRWKGCVIKLLYIDFIVFILAYAVISCIY
ncbi:Bestrophin-3 [Taenia solium]|eukprot:TsM_000379700 transcript=TsM_000379700 gene=TsM_000379700